VKISSGRRWAIVTRPMGRGALWRLWSDDEAPTTGAVVGEGRHDAEPRPGPRPGSV
jgi:proteasome lid subunit RPN8/RPN11